MLTVCINNCWQLACELYIMGTLQFDNTLQFDKLKNYTVTEGLNEVVEMIDRQPNGRTLPDDLFWVILNEDGTKNDIRSTTGRPANATAPAAIHRIWEALYAGFGDHETEAMAEAASYGPPFNRVYLYVGLRHRHCYESPSNNFPHGTAVLDQPLHRNKMYLNPNPPGIPCAFKALMQTLWYVDDPKIPIYDKSQRKLKSPKGTNLGHMPFRNHQAQIERCRRWNSEWRATKAAGLTPLPEFPGFQAPPVGVNFPREHHSKTGFVPKFTFRADLRYNNGRPMPRGQRLIKTIHAPPLGSHEGNLWMVWDWDKRPTPGFRECETFKASKGKVVQFYSNNGYHIVCGPCEGYEQQSRKMVITQLFVHPTGHPLAKEMDLIRGKQPVNQKNMIRAGEQSGFPRGDLVPIMGNGKQKRTGNFAISRNRAGPSNLSLPDPFRILAAMIVDPDNYAPTHNFRISEKDLKALPDYGLFLFKMTGTNARKRKLPIFNDQKNAPHLYVKYITGQEHRVDNVHIVEALNHHADKIHEVTIDNQPSVNMLLGNNYLNDNNPNIILGTRELARTGRRLDKLTKMLHDIARVVR